MRWEWDLLIVKRVNAALAVENVVMQVNALNYNWIVVSLLVTKGSVIMITLPVMVTFSSFVSLQILMERRRLGTLVIVAMGIAWLHPVDLMGHRQNMFTTYFYLAIRGTH